MPGSTRTSPSSARTTMALLQTHSLCRTQTPSATSSASGHPRSCFSSDHLCGDLACGGPGDGRCGILEHEQSCARDLARKGFAVAEGEELVAATVDDERREGELREPLPPARPAVEPAERRTQVVGHLQGGLCARRTVPPALGGLTRNRGVVTEDLRSRGDEIRNRGAVGPVGSSPREQPVHHLRVVIGQVVV